MRHAQMRSQQPVIQSCMRMQAPRAQQPRAHGYNTTCCCSASRAWGASQLLASSTEPSMPPTDDLSEPHAGSPSIWKVCCPLASDAGISPVSSSPFYWLLKTTVVAADESHGRRAMTNAREFLGVARSPMVKSGPITQRLGGSTQGYFYLGASRWWGCWPAVALRRVHAVPPSPISQPTHSTSLG